MGNEEHFRISSYLKDIIGRDLVTNEFVAIFEPVKNCFDAQATRVDVAFDLDLGEIWIVDNGKGMDADGIKDRWLFVAYSAKADGTEDGPVTHNYRDRIRPRGRFAGSKGIGRFSCDTLGAKLDFLSRTSRSGSTQALTVDWGLFEVDSHKLFHRVGVTLLEAPGFPNGAPVAMPEASGTVLRIGELRRPWGYAEIVDLRRYLAKLVDPFGTTDDIPVHVAVFGGELEGNQREELQGPIGNDLRDLLIGKTTRILVEIDGGKIRTELVDRDCKIYSVSETNEFAGLDIAKVRMRCSTSTGAPRRRSRASWACGRSSLEAFSCS